MDHGHPSRDIIGSNSHALAGRRIALGISGSVAAVKSVELAREIMRHGAEVFPVMTPEAQRLVHANLLEWATGNRVVTELTGGIEHVALAGNVEGKADLLVIAPATANTIGKIASGIDDTPVTTLATTALGEGIPMLLVPAMHEPMYNHPIVRRNLDTLREIGVHIMMPRISEGKAKIPETGDIVARVAEILGAQAPDAGGEGRDEERGAGRDVGQAAVHAAVQGRPFAGMGVLVTAGRTVEYIDPVRVITNNSSGKMGVAVAQAARRAGARVTMICGKMSVPVPDGISRVDVETAAEMHAAVHTELADNGHDLFFSVAAVGDWRPREKAAHKLQTAQTERLTLELEPTPKIVDGLSKQYPHLYVVAFRAQHGLNRDELVADARTRLERAGAQCIAVNDVASTDAGFEVDTNSLIVITNDGWVSDTITGTKREVGERLIALVAGNVSHTSNSHGEASR
jgi:phosphopantothenoylcysteine decarboxylase/phosphopantothenate--cysteine ligase